MIEGETTPPPLLQEADLIALMEKHGIGTDATHAEHIETIKSRNYVGVQPDGSFVPGELGMGLVEGLLEYTHGPYYQLFVVLSDQWVIMEIHELMYESQTVCYNS